jgi:outer membrane biosynthesis protein TonB
MSRIGVVIALLAFFPAAGVAQETNTMQPQSQPSPVLPRKIRVSGGVMVGLVERRALPEYPEESLRAGVQGDVIFKIVVDETGKIVLSEPVEGDSLLVAASMDALRDFRFRPYLLNGTPVPRVESQIGFHFDLKGNKTKGQVECMSTIPYRPEFRTGVLNSNGAFILWPRKVSGAEPQLPQELAGKPGSVYLTVTIGGDGKVQDVKVVGGDKQFVDPVVKAVKQFVYEPQLDDGKPSVATIQASYHFGPRR